MSEWYSGYEFGKRRDEVSTSQSKAYFNRSEKLRAKREKLLDIKAKDPTRLISVRSYYMRPIEKVSIGEAMTFLSKMEASNSSSNGKHFGGIIVYL